MLRILFVNGDFGGCGIYRCIMPAREISKQGLAEADVSIVVSEKHIEYYDVFVIQRSCTPEMLDFTKMAKNANKCVIYELDDNLWDIQTVNPAYDFYARKHRFASQIIRSTDAAIVTNNYLGEKLRKKGLCKRYFVIPNYLDRELWDRERTVNNPFRIGWAGTNTHNDDLIAVKHLLKQISATNEIVMLGAIPQGFEEFARYIPFTEYDKYIDNLSEIDIGIAPLVDNEFNRCKSYIKVLEYNALGIPVVASAVENYIYAYNDGAGVLLAKNAGEWDKRIKRLLSDEGLYQSLVQQGKEWASKNWIQDNAWRWVEVSEEVMNGQVRAASLFSEQKKPPLIDTREKYSVIVEKSGGGT